MYNTFQVKIDLNSICKQLNYSLKMEIKNINITLNNLILQPKSTVPQVQAATKPSEISTLPF